eukprot:gene34543-7704_t
MCELVAHASPDPFHTTGIAGGAGGRMESSTCVQRKESECSFIEHLHYKLNVCELDVMFNLEKAPTLCRHSRGLLEKAHFIVEEMFSNGCIVETNKVNSLQSLLLMDKQNKAGK